MRLRRILIYTCALALALVLVGLSIRLAGAQNLQIGDDPDDGVWLQRRDAARADSAVGQLAPLQRQVDALEREIAIHERIDAKQQQLVSIECRMRILALQEAAYWQRRFNGAERDSHRQHEKDRTETGIALGASVGSIVMPGIGTLVGGAIGAGAGWLSAGRAPAAPEPVASPAELDPERACRPPTAPVATGAPSPSGPALLQATSVRQPLQTAETP